ncbi:MAG: phage baseplate assembly protein V [Alphaproteobacteria bacterium]|nr:phage baseplate assembly protein V [Alphaproteobacteria bacterium]
MFGAEVGELDRRCANLVRVGTIAEADYVTAKARVRIGDMVTDWRPWAVGCAGADVTWSAPEVGEQVMLLSPGGNLSLGVIVGGLYQQSAPPPADRPTLRRIVYGDGTVVEYDRESHRLRVDLTAATGTAEIRSGPAVLTVAPDGISLRVGASLLLVAADKIRIEADLIEKSPNERTI